MTHVTCRLTAKTWDQLRDPTLGNRVWATFFIYLVRLHLARTNTIQTNVYFVVTILQPEYRTRRLDVFVEVHLPSTSFLERVDGWRINIFPRQAIPCLFITNLLINSKVLGQRKRRCEQTLLLTDGRTPWLVRRAVITAMPVGL